MNQIQKTFANPVNIVLMALAIGINIAVGQLVTILKLPIYLDSIGTVLVGALLGPVAGFVTGILGTVIWALTLNPGALPYAIVAGIIGLMAGVFGRRGLFTSSSPSWIGAIVGAVFFVAVSVFVLTLYSFTGDIWSIADKNGAPISIGSLFASNQCGGRVGVFADQKRRIHRARRDFHRYRGSCGVCTHFGIHIGWVDWRGDRRLGCRVLGSRTVRAGVDVGPRYHL